MKEKGPQPLTGNEALVLSLMTRGFMRPTWREVAEQIQGNSKNKTKSVRTVRRYAMRGAVKFTESGALDVMSRMSNSQNPRR